METVRVPVGGEIPPVYRWLARQDGERVVPELPVDDEDAVFEYVYYSTYHWQPLMNGHSGYVPRRYVRTLRRMAGFPDARSLRRLRELEVHLVVVHGARYPPARRRALQRRLAASDELAPVRRFEADRVYRLRR
ncbi:MAG: hypothetical protein ICV64_04315 [Thermoleophilia bacterium]|nr:hypothetical protein [Thermoleophilia bacterium]